MKLTPLDIKKQEFTRTFRGIDAAEVQSFLDMVADQWESLLDENRRMEQKVRDLDNKLVHYRKIEEALQEALETARDNSHKTIENAQREAQIIVREAKTAADDLRNKAVEEHQRLKTDISSISGRRDEVMARLRAFLMSELEILSRFERTDMIGGPSQVQLNPASSSYHTPEPPLAYENEIELDQPPASMLDEEPVELPVEEQEASFEEAPMAAAEPAPPTETAEPEVFEAPFEAEPEPPQQTFQSAPPEPAPNGQPEDPTALDGLSSDDLEIIRSSVSEASQEAVKEDFFESAEPEDEQDWLNDQDDEEATGRRISLGTEPRDPATFADDQQTAPPPSTPWMAEPEATPPAEPVTSAPSAAADDGQHFTPFFGGEFEGEDLTATPEEIEKIRRILNDLD